MPNKNVVNSKNYSIEISLNGLIKTKIPILIDLYTISGKHISMLSVNSTGSLWDFYKNQGVRINKGIYLVKIQEAKTSFVVWHE